MVTHGTTLTYIIHGKQVTRVLAVRNSDIAMRLYDIKERHIHGDPLRNRAANMKMDCFSLTREIRDQRTAKSIRLPV